MPAYAPCSKPRLVGMPRLDNGELNLRRLTCGSAHSQAKTVWHSVLLPADIIRLDVYFAVVTATIRINLFGLWVQNKGHSRPDLRLLRTLWHVPGSSVLALKQRATILQARLMHEEMRISRCGYHSIVVWDRYL